MKFLKSAAAGSCLVFTLFFCGVNAFARNPYPTGDELDRITEAVAINAGETVSVDLTQEKSKWVSFAPSESGYYTFEDNGTTHYDSYVVVFNDYSSCLYEDDDSGFGAGFSITDYFVAGRTYYFYCTKAVSSAHMNYVVSLSRADSGVGFSAEVNGNITYASFMDLSVTARADEDIVLKVSDLDADGSTDYRYEWYVYNESHEQVPIAGAASDTFRIPAFSTEYPDGVMVYNGSEVAGFSSFDITRTNDLVFDEYVVNSLSQAGDEIVFDFPALTGPDTQTVTYYLSDQFEHSYSTSPDNEYRMTVGASDETFVTWFGVSNHYEDTLVQGYGLNFIRQSNNTGTVTSDSTTDVSLPFTRNALFGEFLMPECYIYSFTPERTGDYAITSSDVERGNPYVAVFDSGNNCIGYNDDAGKTEGFYNSERYMIIPTDPNHPDPSCNFSLSLRLEEGRTYSIVVWSPLTADLNCYIVNDTDDAAIYKLNVKYLGNTETEQPAVTDNPGFPENQSGNTTPAPSTPTPAIPASTSQPVTETGVAGFVERLYTVALGRRSDPAGKQDWIDAITLRGETGASCARGFLYSPEFLNKGVSNEEFVATLYRTFFNREPDQAGFNAWVGVLNGGTPKEEVIEGFINSTEWANLCLFYGIRSGGTGVPSVEMEPNQATIDFATRLYTTCLNRSADQNGLMAWARQLANQRDTGTGAARGFFFSSEFTGQNVSNGEYVTRLYRTFMGREPDQAGFDAWVEQLDSGVSREEVFDGFAQSIEFAGICASYGIVR